MKSHMKGSVIVLAVVVSAASILGWSQYNSDQVRQAGFVFGNELQQIQDDLKSLQDKFVTSVALWEEGEISRDDLLLQLREHINEFNIILSRYDDLVPPAEFESAVELFRLSSLAQMESDVNYIRWIETGDESAKLRSDLQIQEAFQLELSALAEYNKAKGG